MKKMLFMAATAALALASCTSEDALDKPQKATEDGAVTFSAYTGRAVTRADLVDKTYKLANAGGFGVYAYEQGAADFATYSANASYPNFFYNQQVWEITATADNHIPSTPLTESSTLTWTYSPIKYYSNNDGAKHSFFAYAPYNANIKNVFTLGSAPAIRYNAADDYDLMWASVMNKGKLALEKTIDFNFAHALSQVNIYVAPFVDEVHTDASHTGTESDGTKLTADTKIKVRSVKFVGTVASQGLLNLEKGTWTVEATDEAAYEITTPVELDNTNYTTSNKYAPVKTEMMVIPSKNLQIQIVYDVITTDPNNPANSSTITNTIVSKVEGGFTLAQGTAYNFFLDLGMKTVQFTAEVATWGANTPVNVDLPNNVSSATAAADYNYAGYDYTGSIGVSSDGGTVTFTYASSAVSPDMHEILYDLARYLGALYRAGGVQKIEWNSNNYAWDPTHAGNLQGSNWWNAVTSKTLVSEITTWFASNPTATQITINCDGEDLTLKFVQQ